MERVSPRRKAFTSPELLVVVSIIALLIAILLPALGGNGSTRQANNLLAALGGDNSGAQGNELAFQTAQAVAQESSAFQEDFIATLSDLQGISRSVSGEDATEFDERLVAAVQQIEEPGGDIQQVLDDLQDLRDDFADVSQAPHGRGGRFDRWQWGTSQMTPLP